MVQKEYFGGIVVGGRYAHVSPVESLPSPAEAAFTSSGASYIIFSISFLRFLFISWIYFLCLFLQFPILSHNPLVSIQGFNPSIPRVPTFHKLNNFSQFHHHHCHLRFCSINGHAGVSLLSQFCKISVFFFLFTCASYRVFRFYTEMGISHISYYVEILLKYYYKNYEINREVYFNCISVIHTH